MVNRVARAKQFLPFDALKGLQEAIREKEVEYEEKRDLAEDTLNDLNNKFNQIDNGSFVKITFYKNGKYSEIKGRVTNIDYIKKKIQINKKYNINVCDIVNILI
ncbi:MAG: YolD-like family protein [Clostridia bacterium]|nr:YolD-like family protein [Clostridium sp.]MEE0269147.1 YolD-like family protein [Clostridia bacterium]